jgi:hypothetical protein
MYESSVWPAPNDVIGGSSIGAARSADWGCRVSGTVGMGL